jgi:hypothetical protein
MQYRVKWSRWDTDERQETFEAESDQEAMKVFEKSWAGNSNYDWDWLTLQRIDVVEKVTYLGRRTSLEEGVIYSYSL